MRLGPFFKNFLPLKKYPIHTSSVPPPYLHELTLIGSLNLSFPADLVRVCLSGCTDPGVGLCVSVRWDGTHGVGPRVSVKSGAKEEKTVVH